MNDSCYRRGPRNTVFVTGVLLSLLTPWMFPQTASADPAATQTLWLEGNHLKLKTSVYASAKLTAHPVLIVVLHGDLEGYREIPQNTYEYVFADEVARRIDDVVVAAILRPGYQDHSGDRSEGDAGLATGDNYTPEVVDAIAEVITQLQARYHPAHTVLAGHSGGAAITADLLGRHPSAVDGALLVSCPCDLPAWRKYMAGRRNNNPIWSMPIHALSPQDLANNLSPTVHVAVLVGAKDDVAPPWMSRQYVAAVKKRDPSVSLTIAPGLGHNILLEPVSYAQLQSVVAGLRRRN